MVTEYVAADRYEMVPLMTPVTGSMDSPGGKFGEL